MGIPEFDTRVNINTAGLMIWITRYLLTTGKSVIIVSGFCLLKLILDMSNRCVYVIELIKRDSTGLGVFMGK